MFEEYLTLGITEVEKDVEKRIKTTGVKGLDMKQAKELGVWQRISYLLCAVHATIMAAYRIYGGVDYMMQQLNARRNDIARSMSSFEKSYDKFIKFWADYYANGQSGVDMNEDTEILYHQIMKWAQLPESWQLGDEQRTKEHEDAVIKISQGNGKDLFFHRCTTDTETVGEPKESWCVISYSERCKTQKPIETDVDKSSAMMIAKRMSAEDPNTIYTANAVIETTEKKTDVIPFKAFKAGEVVGNTKKISTWKSI